MKNQIPQPEYFDLKGLNSYSSLPVPTLRDYIKDCGLPCFKVRGKLLVKRSEFDAWLESYRISQDRVEDIVEEVIENLKLDKKSKSHKG